MYCAQKKTNYWHEINSQQSQEKYIGWVTIIKCGDVGDLNP